MVYQVIFGIDLDTLYLLKIIFCIAFFYHDLEQIPGCRKAQRLMKRPIHIVRLPGGFPFAVNATETP